MTTENSDKNPDEFDPGSDSESEDVFHDARFPAEEEATVLTAPLERISRNQNRSQQTVHGWLL